ncbi:MAG: hypothetical protein KGI10_02675 [Thaumarchaeota archaeon]|nr:hypothetical protein [Nitrososphaerota archaeon]
MPIKPVLGVGQSQYLLYKNANYGFSIEYPATWYHEDLTATAGNLSPVAYFAPDSKTTNTWLSVNYQKDSTALRGLSGQQILNTLTATMQHNCQQYSLRSNGFTCSNPQFKSNVETYRGLPSYEVLNTWTKTLPDGSTLDMISIWAVVPVQNDLYAIVMRLSTEAASVYQSELTHMLSSFDVYSVPEEPVTPKTDYSNFGLQKGESISYRYSMSVQASDMETQQTVTNVMLQSLAKQIGNVTLNSIDDVQWIKYTVTNVSSTNILFNEETKVRNLEVFQNQRDIKYLQGTAIPITSKVGDSFDIFSSGAGAMLQGTVNKITTINLGNTDIPVFELSGSTRNVSQDGATVTTLNATAHYDKKTGLMLDGLVDMKIVGAKYLKMHYEVKTIDWSELGKSGVQPSQATAIPGWIKNTAKWWAQGQVTDSDFITGIQYMIQQGLIKIPTTTSVAKQSQGIPSWIKNTAKWWADGTVADSDFIKSVQYLVQTGVIVTQTADQAQGAVTDQQGIATFQISGQNVQFSFVDDTTGQPLSGVDVVFALDPKTQSVGTLLVIDPNKHYPLQIIVLTGSVPSSNVATSWENYGIPNASAETKSNIVVKVLSDPRTVGSLMLVTFLPGVGAVAGDIVNNLYEGVALAAKYADKRGWLPVSSYLENHGYMTGTTTLDKAKEEIHEETIKGSVRDAIFLTGGSVTGYASHAIKGATVGTTINTATTIMDISTVSGCNPQTEEIKWVQIGFTRIYSCTTNKAFGLLRYDPPTETNHISLELLSKANPGFGERIQTEKGQPVPVPADNYNVQISAPGKTPKTEDVTVLPQQTSTIQSVLQPIPSNNVAVEPIAIHVSSGSCTVNEYCDVLIATASGGLAPYHFQSDTFRNGTPPFGMTIGIYGHSTGTPTREGSYDFGVCVVDTAGKSDCSTATITVNPSKKTAGDLTGHWSGTFNLVDVYSGITCKFQSTFEAEITQSGNALTGTVSYAPASSESTLAGSTTPIHCSFGGLTYSLSGSVSSSSFTVTSSDGELNARGIFTSSTIQGTFTACGAEGCDNGSFQGSKR